tara:strand:- start:2138 stop:2806 length:669 start_codon:yes stop_codon:yes gene_type:complete
MLVFMEEGYERLPPDMRPFIATPVAQPLIKGRNVALAGSAVVATLLFLLLRQFALSTTLAAGCSLLSLGLNVAVVYLRFNTHASTPLAVNMNHPFMNSEAMGEAKVLVRLLNGSWIDPGNHRVRTIPEELLGGYNLVQDTDDYPVLGHFVSNNEKGPALSRHLALINQAIALRDAVNDVPDPIEEAREREKMETGLLERSWFEEEAEVEVESPLVSFFRGKD